MRFSVFAPAVLAGAALCLANTASAQTLQATLYQSGFASPIFLCSPPGDLARQFVVEQTGRIRIITGGATLATPFLHLGSVATGGLGKISTGSERGLLGLAFHPNYAANGFFYVNYTNTAGSTVIARYQVSANPNVASTTETILLTIAQPQSNHNGGCIQFGLDGMLYIGMGDGGSANDSGTGHATGGNGQSPSTLLGKILRIDVDLPAPYVPASNPYFGAGDPLDEIWHMGVRNPWRFSFDRGTGDMYIGDVGQDAVEEVSYAPAGASGLNFGWRCMEGLSCTGLSGCTCNAASLTAPIRDYAQGASHCAVTGGYVYRGTNVCGFQGTYFYGDYCSSTIWSFQYSGGSVLNHTNRTTELEPAGTPTIGSISSFGEDAQGEIYILDYSDGEIYRIDPAGGAADCNANGIADGCDIQNGTSLDCNGNSVPDECDVASGTPDCNANLIPDSCDIASGTSLDANSNGIPDECECVGGAPPFVYCTAKLNSQFCLPSIGYTGTPSLSGSPFSVTAVDIINNKTGLLFYGYLSHNAPFQGGTMCVRSPVRRTPVANSGGSPTGTDCSGTFAFDFAAWMNSGADPLLANVGQQVNAQFWSRDPQDQFTTSLTDAVQFQICQ